MQFSFSFMLPLIMLKGSFFADELTVHLRK